MPFFSKIGLAVADSTEKRGEFPGKNLHRTNHRRFRPQTDNIQDH